MSKSILTLCSPPRRLPLLLLQRVRTSSLVSSTRNSSQSVTVDNLQKEALKFNNKLFRKPRTVPKSRDQLNASSVHQICSESSIENKDESDIFGLLADLKKSKNPGTITPKYHEEEFDDDTEVFRKDHAERNSVMKYNLEIRELLRKNKLKDALELFENKMLAEDKVKPSPWTYSLLINGCGDAGYTKKAFKLFKRMRDRGMKPTPATITGLFSSCANSPFKDVGLEKAKGLREKIFEKGWQLNSTHYRAMITAFGKCGDAVSAFQIVDEMMSEEIPINISTINSLITACVSDSKEGLKNAILVWRKMRLMKLKPDIYSYNLLLRTIRDCNVGDFPSEDLLNVKEVADDQQSSGDDGIKNPDAKSEVFNDAANSTLTVVDQSKTIPDILSPNPRLTNVVYLNNMDKCENRLALFGGMPGILSQMVRDGAKPNVKTFTQLLDVIPATKLSEEQLLVAMDEHKVIPDVDMCNMLIKRRAYRYRDKDALDVLNNVMNKYGISPNIMTYGVLALTCRSDKAVTNLLKSMDESGLRLNVEIMGALVKNACMKNEPTLVLKLMNRIKDDELAVSPVLLKNLDSFVQSEQCQTQKKFKRLRMHYKDWLRQIPVDVPQHPWKQYHINKPDVSDETKDNHNNEQSVNS